MELILKTYKANVGKKSMFSKIITIDFYDGPVEAICQIADSEEWFISSLVYFEIENNQRIFSLIRINDDLLPEFKKLFTDFEKDRIKYFNIMKDKINNCYKNFLGNAFLFKSDWLLSINYKVVKSPFNSIDHFNSIEEILAQKKEAQLKWINLF